MRTNVQKALLTGLLILTGIAASLSPANATGPVKVLSSSGYLDSQGNYRVVGEVTNRGSTPINFVQVQATFYDSLGSPITTRFDLTMLYVILPNRESPFELALLDTAQSSRVSTYTLTVSYQETTAPPMKLEILWHTTSTDAQGNMHITGALKNHGDEKLINAKVAATYYDPYSRVVAAASIGFDPDLVGDINPNQTIQFQIDLPKERAQYAHSYALAAESNQYTMIPEHPTTTLLLILLPPITLTLITRNRRKRKPIAQEHPTRVKRIKFPKSLIPLGPTWD
jgi:hypothetical protein